MSSHLIDRGVAVAIAALCVWLYGVADDFPLGSDLFPKFALITVFSLTVLLFAQTFVGGGGPSGRAATGPRGWDAARPYVLFGISLLFALLMYLVGFLLASVATALLLVPVLGVRKRLLYGLVTGGTILFVYVLFNRFLMVQLPVGILFD